MIHRTSFLVACFTLGAALIGYSGCSRSSHKAVTLAGSTAFQPFAEKLAEKFMASHPEVQINVQGGGSAVGIQSALSGAAAIGMADLLQLPPEASKLTSTIVARDGIAIIVHPSNALTALSAEQAMRIFSGEIKKWSELGGKDQSIRIISREEGSGTRRSFDKLVLGKERLSAEALFQNSNGTIREAVASDPDAIGYLSIGLLDPRVKGLSYNGIAPTNAAVIQGTYPLARPIFFLTQGPLQGDGKLFQDYVLSSEAQKILQEEGLIPVN